MRLKKYELKLIKQWLKNENLRFLKKIGIFILFYFIVNFMGYFGYLKHSLIADLFESVLKEKEFILILNLLKKNETSKIRFFEKRK